MCEKIKYPHFHRAFIVAVHAIVLGIAASTGIPYSDHGNGKIRNFEEILASRVANRSNLLIRPSGCPVPCDHPVLVNLTYNVIQIMAFTQTEETMKISGWFTMWYDFRLQWVAPDFGNVEFISLVGDGLWRPDVGLMNGKDGANFDFSSTPHSRLTIESDGRITWMYGAVLDVACPLDFADFPFDTQVCHLIITPWQSSSRQFQLTPIQHGPVVDNNYLPNSNVSEWEIQSVDFHSEFYVSQLDVPYQYIKVSIRLKRQPLYFIILVLVPFGMLSILACLIFTLDDTGDRLSVALSLILSMTMYVVIVSSNAPRSMRTVPLLGVFLLDQMGLLCIATVAAAMNNKLHSYCNFQNLYMNEAVLRDRSTRPDDVFDSEIQDYLECPGTCPPTGDEDTDAGSDDDQRSTEEWQLPQLYIRRPVRLRPLSSHPQGVVSFSSECDRNLVGRDFDHESLDRKDDSCYAGIHTGSRFPGERDHGILFKSPGSFGGYHSSSDMSSHQHSPIRKKLKIDARHSLAQRTERSESLKRKIQKLYRLINHPRSVQLRSRLTSIIDCTGILVYLLATFLNAVLCLLILPGKTGTK